MNNKGGEPSWSSLDHAGSCYGSSNLTRCKLSSEWRNEGRNLAGRKARAVETMTVNLLRETRSFFLSCSFDSIAHSPTTRFWVRDMTKLMHSGSQLWLNVTWRRGGMDTFFSNRSQNPSFSLSPHPICLSRTPRIVHHSLFKGNGYCWCCWWRGCFDAPPTTWPCPWIHFLGCHTIHLTNSTRFHFDHSIIFAPILDLHRLLLTACLFFIFHRDYNQDGRYC